MKQAGAAGDDGTTHADCHGRHATSPLQMRWPAWKDVLTRTWQQSSEDNIGLVAAGVAFYGFLAIVPLLASTVLLYGLVASPEAVVRHMGRLMAVLPSDAAVIVTQQLGEVVAASDGKKGLGLVAALAIAIFGARNAAAAIITALNIAYEERESRGIIRQTILALAITVAAIAFFLLALIAIAVLGRIEAALPALPDSMAALGKIVAYVLLACFGAAGAATLYRYGPNRANARWIWLTPGSIASALGWLGLTLGFGLYVANVSDYNATYGSLSAVVILLTWLYLSSYIFLLGAELNSELEHQTMRDTTEGAERPMGRRDAWVADHVAGTPPIDAPDDGPGRIGAR